MKNNWKIAFRHFRKNKFYSLLNLSGLVVGLAACFLLMMYRSHESSFDLFHSDIDQIYQVNLVANFGGDAFQTSNTPPPVGETMQREFPEITAFTRHFMPGDIVVRYNNQFFTEADAWAVDSNFLAFFTFPLLEGDVKNCLSGTNSLVLTESTAKKYFGENAALGEVLLMEEVPYTVTGIIADLPPQSSLQFDMLYPIAASRLVERFSWSWVWLQVDTYVKLQGSFDESEPAVLEAKFPEMVLQHAAKAFQRIGQPLDEFLKKGNQWELSLKPLADVHLNSEGISSRLATLGSQKEVSIFGWTGLFILLLACINFMNLSTARSMKRAKEIGVRKVLGSERWDLIKQFMVEAFFYGMAATLLAISCTQLCLPYFNQLIGVQLSMAILFSSKLLFFLFAAPFIIAFLSGSYPALYLSGFKPIGILKNNITTKKGGHALVRNGLVVFQFAISVALISATLIIFQQIKFTQNADIGIHRDNVAVITNTQRLGNQSKAYKEALLRLPQVTHTTISSDLPTRGFFGDFYVPETNDNRAGIAQNLTLYSYLVDEDFVPTMNIQLLAGRNFDEQFGTDHAAVIINETAANIIGWEEPVGKYIRYPGNGDQRFQVVGVMKDFHTHSFRSLIEPFALFHESSNTYNLNQEFMAVRLGTGQEADFIDKAVQLWNTFSPDAPFDFSFLQEDYTSLYQSESRLGNVLWVFTVLSIFIACLGLLGLIAFMIEQRTKEIGIRKVLGASVAGITTLLAQRYIGLIFIAFLVAIPFSWYFMNHWLADFEYRIDIEWWMFAIAGVGAIIIAAITISFQSIKAAVANPIHSLRSE